MDVETIRHCLTHGDYQVFSLPGFSIERKSLADLYSSIGRRENFVGRLEAMAEQGVASAVVVEASLETAIGCPPPFTKIRPKTVARTIQRWSLRYPTKWWFCPGREWAESWTFRLLEGWWKEHAK